jgi:hypothetical protein
MSQLIERLREAHDNFAGLEGVSNDDLVAVLDAATALTQPPSPAAAGGTDLDHVTALDRLRLHVHDPETFAFDYDDCVSLEEQIDAMLSARPPIGETVPGAGWQLEAMRKTVALMEAKANGRDMGGGLDDSLRQRHLHDMLAAMEADNNPQGGTFSAAKLGRWLGWAQAAVVAMGLASLDEMKEINKNCSAAPSLAPTQEGEAP